MILISIILVIVYNNNPMKIIIQKSRICVMWMGYATITGWWFQTFFVFHDTWDNPSHWLIFLKMVKTTMLLSLIGTSAAFRPRLVSLISCLLAIGVLFYCGLTAIYVQLVWRSASSHTWTFEQGCRLHQLSTRWRSFSCSSLGSLKPPWIHGWCWPARPCQLLLPWRALA